MNMILIWLQRLWKRLERPHKLIVIEDDTPPQILRSKHVYLAHEDGTDWAVAMLCPCGCGDRLELMLIPEAKPNWRLLVNNKGMPSLKPSVWREKGCKSHFWLRDGRVVWCE